MPGTQEDFAHKLEDLEKRLVEHGERFSVVFEVIRGLMQPAAVPPKRRIPEWFSRAKGATPSDSQEGEKKG